MGVGLLSEHQGARGLEVGVPGRLSWRWALGGGLLLYWEVVCVAGVQMSGWR